MSQLRIFVSSTCYDLVHIRQGLNRDILALGHIPIMSEFTSFAIDPSLNLLENCRNNVRTNADVFLLILGGKRGSVDPTEKKSIVNLEYEAAIQEGLDVYVFVDQAVHTLLPVWQKNKEVSFEPTVDSNAVLAFLHTLKENQHWVFPFTKEADIAEVLALQLSRQLKDLIEKKRAGYLDTAAWFREEGPTVQSLVRTRPSFWEYTLTADLLEKRLTSWKARFKDIQNGLILGSHKSLGAKEYLDFVTAKFAEVVCIVDKFKSVLERDITIAWGLPGEPGDALAILNSIREMESTLEALISFESEVYRTHGPDFSLPLKRAILGTTEGIVSHFENAPQELRDAVRRGLAHKEGDPPISINLTFKVEFTKLQAVNEAIKQFGEGITSNNW